MSRTEIKDRASERSERERERERESERASESVALKVQEKYGFCGVLGLACTRLGLRLLELLWLWALGALGFLASLLGPYIEPVLLGYPLLMFHMVLS